MVGTLLAAVLGLPLFGKIFSSGAKKDVKRTLAGVDEVVNYFRFFLNFVSAIIIFLLILLFIRFLLKRKRLKKLRKIMTLLHRIQSDLALLREGESLAEKQLLEMYVSKKEAVVRLKLLISDRFFKIRLGLHAFRRMNEALLLMGEDKMSLKNQENLVGQWLKTIDVLCR